MSSPSVPDSSAATDAHTRVDDNATTPVETPTNAAASAEVKSPAAESVTTPGQPAPGNVDPNAQLTVRALVSTKEAGIIIGKGGANVAELRDKTGVKAGVSKVVQGVHDRVLSVTGPLDGISQVSDDRSHHVPLVTYLVPTTRPALTGLLADCPNNYGEPSQRRRTSFTVRTTRASSHIHSTPHLSQSHGNSHWQTGTQDQAHPRCLGCPYGCIQGYASSVY